MFAKSNMGGLACQKGGHDRGNAGLRRGGGRRRIIYENAVKRYNLGGERAARRHHQGGGDAGLELQEARRTDPDLAEPERRYARKYSGSDTFIADGRHAWLRITPEKLVSWDFRKLNAPRPS